MNRSLFRPAIILPISLVLLAAVIFAVFNIFEIRIGLKPSASADEQTEPNPVHKSDASQDRGFDSMRPPPPPGADDRFSMPPPDIAGNPSRQPPQLQKVPMQFLAPHGDLMSDIGVPDAAKEKALAALQAFDAEMKEQMNAALRGGTPPSPEVFQEMEARRDEQIRSAIGERNFEAYKQNLDTIPERAALGSLQQRLERSGGSLSQAQSDRLFQAMVNAARTEATDESGASQPRGRANIDARFDRVSEAMRASSEDFTEAQQNEINRFIEDTIEMRSRMKRR